MGKLIALFTLISLGCALEGQRHKHRVPVLNLPSNTEVYHGAVKEDDRVVSLSPSLSVVEGSGPICSYVILGDFPFVAEVTQRETGAAQLRVKDGASIDCKSSPYRFQIAAERCETLSRSDSATVEVVVQDTNNHEPEFEDPWYTVEVDEGRLYGEILRIEAKDKDCGHPYGEICRYEITNNAKPFRITQEGVLKNTQPLNYTESHSYIVEVRAHDCGMKRSRPVLITVKVREVCNLGLHGVPDSVDYYPGVGSKKIAIGANLALCDVKCEVEKVEGKISLSTEHIGRGCDRANFASDLEREECGTDSEMVDLLRPKGIEVENSSEEEQEETGKEETDENGVDSEQNLDEVFLFDGVKNAIVVPPSTAKPYVTKNFTLSFWMKHDRHEKTSGHFKENVVCSSDDHKMNRHHFAVYIRNCKLEMLVRTEPGEVGPEMRRKFRPAEWRWRTPDVCDNEWHHYTINAEFPEVSLMVDGKPFQTTSENSEILDDYPLHPEKNMKTRLVVGACWQGRTSTMGQFFKGYLLNMMYLPGKIERSGVMQCLHQCKEQLEFQGLDSLKPGETAVFKNDESEVTLSASSLDEFARMLRSVAYVNLRHQPTPGHRGFSVKTSLRCKDNTDPIDIPEVKGYVFVKKAPEPKLELDASPVIVRSHTQVHEGSNVLPDLKIKVTQPTNDEDGSSRDTSAKHKLDWCKIKLRPKLDKENEYFSSPAGLLGSLHLDFENDKDGLILKGIEKVKGYQEILSQIHYFNLHPSQYPKRIFLVQCSMLNGRVLSNELPISMSIKPSPTPAIVVKQEKSEEKEAKEEEEMELHKEPHHETKEEQTLKRMKNILMAEPARPKLGPLPSILHEAGYKTDRAGSGAVAGGAIAIVVVVCIGFLLVVIVVGILKMKTAPVRTSRGSSKYHRPGAEGEGDLAWDDSGMNITVNPIMDVEAEGGVAHSGDEYTDDSSDDGDSFRDEDEELTDDDDDEDGEEVLPHVSNSRQSSTGLEWDDSTLHANTHSPSSKTYRV